MLTRRSKGLFGFKIQKAKFKINFEEGYCPNNDILRRSECYGAKY